ADDALFQRDRGVDRDDLRGDERRALARPGDAAEAVIMPVRAQVSGGVGRDVGNHAILDELRGKFERRGRVLPGRARVARDAAARRVAAVVPRRFVEWSGQTIRGLLLPSARR